MYRGYLIFAILIVRLHGSILDDECNTGHRNNCHIGEIKDPKHDTVVTNFCKEEEIPEDINFIVGFDENGTYEVPSCLDVVFSPPKIKRKYGITLQVNSSIDNENDCMNYDFQRSLNPETETHTPEQIVYTIPTDHHNLIYHDDSTVCQDTIVLSFQYIFTGCYGLRFRLDDNKYVVKSNVFLKTNYSRVDITEPDFYCTYDIVPAVDDSKKMIFFAAEISMLTAMKVQLKLGLWTDLNGRKDCHSFADQSLWTINFLDQDARQQQNCTTTSVQTEDGKNLKQTECKYMIETSEIADYCFRIRLDDDRCRRHTLWNPPLDSAHMPCTWISRCTRIFQNKLRYTYDSMQTHTWMGTNVYLILTIVVTLSVMFILLGTIYFVCYVRTCKNENARFYICTRKRKSTKKLHNICNKSKIYELESDEKEMEYDGITHNNIVLLYPRSSPPFMALMADFRGILTRVCQCYVHDWYDRTAWNHVAELGGPDWFTEILRKGSYVIWIDTPAMRSLITNKFKKVLSTKKSELTKFVEIGDFRDGVFPVIFSLAKRYKHESALQYCKHLIVRLKGFENFENEDDPFIELSPHAHFVIPQDLKQLCSQLAAMRSMVFSTYSRKEEILLRQHLTRVKNDNA